MLAIFIVIDGLVALSLLILALLALLQGGHKQYRNRLFAVFTILVAFWVPANHISNDLMVPPHIALWADFIVFPSSFGAMIILMRLIAEISNLQGHIKWIKKASPFLWLICLLSATPLVASGVERGEQTYTIIFGPLTPLYASALFIMIGYTFHMLIKGLRGERKSKDAHTLQTIGFGLTVSLPLIVVLSFILPVLTGNFVYTQFGITPIILLVAAIFYSAIKHRLFDIRAAAVRSLTYALVLLTLSATYYLLAYLLSQLVLGGKVTDAVSISPVNIFLALLLAFLFQPIKRFFDRITDKIFYRESYNTQEFFAEFGELLASTTDLRGLLERASNEIATTLKAEQSFFFLYYSNAIRHHMSSGTRGHSRLPFFDAKILDAYVMGHQEQKIIFADFLPSDSDVRRMLISHRISLVMPLLHKNHTIGYLCLGDQLGSGYTKRDIGVLKTISNELVIAIQNALSVHEVREINATLEQRIKAATVELRESNAQLHRLDEAKNEFVSMASHQLRTPLTSVKGYISMILDGDVGKITDTQRNALEEAFNSSERMVRLIGDFLSVSRLQTGKFVIEKKPIDLVKVVGQEVDGVRIIASTHGQKLAFAHPKKPIDINIDEAKIRQVIMNFIDNAIYYSRPDSTIHIAVGVVQDEVVFTVEDTGIGVPEAEQKKLFSKFYRASNARQQRPDGTGVGLFLAKKIITAHDGKVVFSSIEGRGSTFGFRIPLKQKPNETDSN